MERGSSKAPPLYRPARSSNYNFVHAPPPQSPHRHHDPALPTTTLDTIVAQILEAWAVRLTESPDGSTDDEKDNSERPTVPERVRKLWQAVVRQSHTGLHGRASDDVVGQHALPNPICTAICVEILVEILHAVLPRHAGIADVLIGGLVHSIYSTYDPSKSYYANTMYAHAGQENSTQSLVQTTVRTLYTVYSHLDPPTQRSVAIELIKPQLTTDILGDLWDVLMAKLPPRDHSQAATHMVLFSRCFGSLPRDEKREILPMLASSIQRRIDEFAPSYPVLTPAQQSSQDQFNDQDDAFDEGGDVPTPWEPPNFHESSKRRPRGSVARASFLKPQTAPSPMEFRKTSILVKPSLVRGSSSHKSGRNLSFFGSANNTAPTPTMALRKPSEARKSTMVGLGSSFRRKTTRIHDVGVLRPEQLHGVLPLVGASRASAAPPTLVKQPSMLGTAEPDTSAELLEFLDELADDLKEIYALLRAGEYRSQQSGMQDFAQLLTTRLHMSLDDVDNEHGKGSADPKDKELMAVTSIIQLLKAHPLALGSVLKQMPDLVVETLRSQQGILKYCMVHCSWVVRQFLKLDAAATDAWQSIVKAQSKGLTLLWSTDQYAADEVVVSPIEAAYQWLQNHVTDAAKVLLLNHDLAKLIFAAMEREVVTAKATNKGLRLKMLLTELEDLPTFQAHTHLATQKGLDMAIKHDMKGVVTMLTIILSNNAHLKELVASSVEVTAALAVHNKHALLNLLNSDVVTWKPFFVQIMTQNNFLLTDCLMTKTKHLAGGDQLMVAFHSVLDGIAGHWVTDDADQPTGVTFKARGHFQRALSVLRLSQHRRNKADPSLEGDEGLDDDRGGANTMSGNGKGDKSSTNSPSSNKGATMRQRQMLDGIPRASVVPGVYHTPWIWKTFLIDATLERSPTTHQHPWGRRELKRFILDILIEKIKVDELEVDEEVVIDLSVFVCDYLTNKLQNRSLVCFQLQQLVNGLQKHIEDPRVSFFAAACGVKQPLRRGVLHSCLRSLSHLLFGELRIFRPEKRLQELVDGSCVVPVAAVEDAARNVFAQCLSSEEMIDIAHEIASLRLFPASDISHELNHVDLDDAMAVYLQQWQRIEGHMDEQFILAFNRFRGANQEFVGIDQFVKIVTTVTRHGVSVRDCRLIFYDTGKEMIDLNTVLRLTQEYDLRISLAHPKIMLNEDDFDCIRRNLGISSVLSFEDEFKQLVACWTEVKPKIDKQIASLHQTEETKRDLAYHLQAVEDSLAYLRSGIDTPSMNTVWETFRSSIASLQAAVNAQRSFSILYVQCHVRKWVSKLKRRKSERRSLMLQEASAAAATGHNSSPQRRIALR